MTDDAEGEAETPEFNRRDFDLNHVYPLHREFPVEFGKICKLKPLQQWIKTNSKDELQIKLGEIIYAYRNRYLDSADERLALVGENVPACQRPALKKTANDELPYFNRIYEAVQELRAAVNALKNATDRLVYVDLDHFRQISRIARSLPNSTVQELDPYNVQVRLREISTYVAILAVSIQLGTGTSLAPPRKGRPGNLHLWPATALIELWEELSGAAAVYPRGSALGKDHQVELTQPSTEFVRLALKMIDPPRMTDPTSAAARTIPAIRGALQLRKDLQRSESTLESMLEELVASAVTNAENDAN
jgi:hypothetical protein